MGSWGCAISQLVCSMHKFMIVLDCDYYKFGCFVDVFSCGLVGDIEIA